MVIQNFRLIYLVKHDVEDGIEHRVQNSMLSSLSRRYFFFYYSVICSSECASTAEFGLCMKKKIKVETDTKEEKTNLMGQVILLYYEVISRCFKLCFVGSTNTICILQTFLSVIICHAL